MSTAITGPHIGHEPELRDQNRYSDRFTTLGIVARDCRQKVEEDSMSSLAQFCDSTCADQMHMAERELSAFIGAVTQLFGPDEAKLSAEDWLNQALLMDSPRLSTSRNWREVTIAASARLANRLTVHCSPELAERKIS